MSSMNFMVATINMADLIREVKVGYFRDDTKVDFYSRYMHKLNEGYESEILSHVLKMMCHEKNSDGISLRVELAPFSLHKITLRYLEILNIRDLCEELAEMSMSVLNQARKSNG